MRISHQLFQKHFQVPKDWHLLPTYKLFEEIGLASFFQAGLPTFLPIGQRLVNVVNSVIREESLRAGFDEVYLPLIQDEAFLEKTGRASKFNNEFFRILDSRLILTPTNEEAFIHLSSHAPISYRQLPIRMFQIADKFRNIDRPKGIFRSKEFLMCDMVSIDRDEKMLRNSATIFEEIVEAVFRRLKTCVIRVEKNEGRYVDFLIECQEGNTTIARNPDRYQQHGIPASSVAMYFLFDHHGPKFHESNGNFAASCLGTYGFGIQRCIHAIIEQHRDNLGISFPKLIRPFGSSVILLDPNDSKQNDLAEECYRKLVNCGSKPLFDDRPGKILKEKAILADFFGIPFKLVIGNRETESRTVTLKWRDGKQETIPCDSDTFLRIINNS